MPRLLLPAQSFHPLHPSIVKEQKGRRALGRGQGYLYSSSSSPKSTSWDAHSFKSRILVVITSLEGKKTVFPHLTRGFSSSDKYVWKSLSGFKSDFKWFQVSLQSQRGTHSFLMDFLPQDISTYPTSYTCQMSSSFIQTLFHFLKLQLSWRKKELWESSLVAQLGSRKPHISAASEGVFRPPLS